MALADLPRAPFWRLLPDQLQAELANTLAAGEPRGTAIRLLWSVRERLLGKPSTDYERTRARCRLRLGLMYLTYRERRMEAYELLSRAFHVADSYVCGLDGRPFLRLRRELEGAEAAAAHDSLSELFAPYVAEAEECVARWGLRAP